MSYSKLFNIQSVKSSDRVCGRITPDIVELSYNGSNAVLEKMDYINVRTTEEQIEDLKKQLELGNMDEELFESRLERLQKIPDFVFAHVHARVEGKYYPIGDICTRRDGSGKYLKVKCDQLVTVENGKKVKYTKDSFLNVQSKSQRKERFDYLLNSQKMKQETYDGLVSDLEKEPDFVLFRVDGKGEEI